MANRIIKESAFTSDSIANLTDFQFRLWIGLITQADDYGRGDARPDIIKGRVFALRKKVREQDIAVGLTALANNGSISLYEVDGKPFYAFPKWADHQRVRNAKPKYPGPDADGGNSPRVAANGGEMRPSRARAESNPIQSNPNPNPNPTRVREDEQDPGFTNFWNAYPRKSGDIRQAFMAYLHAMDLGATPEKLVEAIKTQTEGVTAEDMQFMPSAEKWLRNRGWESKGTYKRVQRETKKSVTTAAEYKAPTPAMSPAEIMKLVDQI